MANNIVQLNERSEHVLAKIRQFAKQSSRVIIPDNLNRYGTVSISQIWQCLESGAIKQGPLKDDHDNIVCELEGVCSGKMVRIVVVFLTIDQKEMLLVQFAEEC